MRVDLPAGAAGTPAKSVLTNATAVLVAPGGAVLVDPRFITRPLYAEAMKSVATAKEGAFVLTLHNVTANRRRQAVGGGRQCPALRGLPVPGNRRRLPGHLRGQPPVLEKCW